MRWLYVGWKETERAASSLAGAAPATAPMPINRIHPSPPARLSREPSSSSKLPCLGADMAKAPPLVIESQRQPSLGPALAAPLSCPPSRGVEPSQRQPSREPLSHPTGEHGQASPSSDDCEFAAHSTRSPSTGASIEEARARFAATEKALAEMVAHDSSRPTARTVARSARTLLHCIRALFSTASVRTLLTTA
jgi:hypothetical protein